MDDAMPAVARG